MLEGNRGTITVLSYSPDGKYLAVGDTDRKIMVYDTKTHEIEFNQWVFHSARVNSIAWSANSKYAVSGALDRDIYVWSVEKPMKYIAIKGKRSLLVGRVASMIFVGAHQEGVSGVAFLDEMTIVSTGSDACVKTWSIVHH